MKNLISGLLVVFGVSSCGGSKNEHEIHSADPNVPTVGAHAPSGTAGTAQNSEKAFSVASPSGSMPHGGVSVPAADCSGSFFKMDGMTDDQMALVLTNGHCVGLGSFQGRYPDNNELFIDYPSSSHVIARKDKSERGELFRYDRLLFATMTGVDLAVIELKVSYKDLMDRGHSIYTLAKEVPKPGSTLVFDSYNRDARSMCKVEKAIHQVKEGPWTWKHSLRLEASSHCSFVHGQSGTPGVDESSHLIYSLAQTVYEGQDPCTFDNPCEVSEDGHVSVGKVGQSYAVPVTALYNCFQKELKKFDFNLATCDLNFKRSSGR